MTVHNHQDLRAFSSAGEADALTTTFGHGKRCIDEALALVNRAFFSQRNGEPCENFAQDLTSTPLPKPVMHGLVVGIALREQVPLGAGVQNPELGFQDGPGRKSVSAGAAFRNVFLRKVRPDVAPLVVAQMKHAGAL